MFERNITASFLFKEKECVNILLYEVFIKESPFTLVLHVSFICNFMPTRLVNSMFNFVTAINNYQQFKAS